MPETAKTPTTPIAVSLSDTGRFLLHLPTTSMELGFAGAAELAAEIKRVIGHWLRVRAGVHPPGGLETRQTPIPVSVSKTGWVTLDVPGAPVELGLLNATELAAEIYSASMEWTTRRMGLPPGGTRATHRAPVTSTATAGGIVTTNPKPNPTPIPISVSANGRVVLGLPGGDGYMELDTEAVGDLTRELTRARVEALAVLVQAPPDPDYRPPRALFEDIRENGVVWDLKYSDGTPKLVDLHRLSLLLSQARVLGDPVDGSHPIVEARISRERLYIRMEDGEEFLLRWCAAEFRRGPGAPLPPGVSIERTTED